MAFISQGQVQLGFAPQALGELVPALTNGYYYSKDGLFITNAYATYAAMYQQQPAIATVVDKVAMLAARLPVRTWDPTPATGKKEDLTSPLALLMRNPCPIMPRFDFWRWTVSTYEIYGEAFWWKMRLDNGDIEGYVPMHPARTAIKRDQDGTIHYVFTLGIASSGILRASEDDVVAFRRYNPNNLMRGLSRMEPLRSTLVNEDAARRAGQAWWQKGARPSVVITHPGDLSQKALDRIKTNFDARHASADNSGSSLVLDEGMTIQPIQLSAEEMQYIESRKMNREEVCMVYDVPPPAVHILDHATFSNITEQMRMVYRDTMAPRLEDYESVLAFSVIPDFFPAGQRVVEFDMRDVLRGDYETRADKAALLRNAGIFTGNMALDLMGEPRSSDPEMDKFYINAALVPIGTPSQAMFAHQQDTQQANQFGGPNQSQKPDPDQGQNESQSQSGGGNDSGSDDNKSRIEALFKSGNAQALFDYWTTGDGAGKIGWGEDGDFDRCVQEVGQYMDDPEGYCAEAHHAATGEWPAQHAAQDRGKALRLRVYRSVMGRKAKTLTDVKKALAAEHEKELEKFFQRQKGAVKAARKDYGSIDSDSWNDDLASILAPLSAVTAKAVGDMVAATLNGAYDETTLSDWLDSSAKTAAININAATISQLKTWIENQQEDNPDTDEFFDDSQSSRASRLGWDRVAYLAGFVGLVSAEQNDASTKTWRAMASDPRPSHAAMDGETVGLDDTFSNGMNGPGDTTGGADEVAGCTCELEFGKE